MHTQDREDLLGAVESILFVAGDSVALDELAAALQCEEEKLAEILDGEALRREQSGRGLLLKRFEGRVQLCSRPEYGELVTAVLGKQTSGELTRAMLETLSIVAYRQPVTRADVETVRGVNASYAMNALLARGLICEAGRKDAVGRPRLYRTTEGFLRHFGIESIEELPELPSQED